MVVDVERVELSSDGDLRRVLEQINADGVPRIVERHGEPMAVVVHPADFGGAASKPASRRHKQQLLSFAGIWRDLDGDRLIDYISEGRRQSPASPSVEL